MKKLWLVVTLELLLFSVQDIMIWQRIFEADGLYQYADTYHAGWGVTLVALTLAAFVWLWPDWRRALLHGAILLTLAFSGLEDVLYYVLDGKALPELLPWLDAHPLIFWSPVTREALLVNVGLWLIAWAAITLRPYPFRAFRMVSLHSSSRSSIRNSSMEPSK